MVLHGGGLHAEVQVSPVELCQGEQCCLMHRQDDGEICIRNALEVSGDGGEPGTGLVLR